MNYPRVSPRAQTRTWCPSVERRSNYFSYRTWLRNFAGIYQRLARIHRFGAQHRKVLRRLRCICIMLRCVFDRTRPSCSSAARQSIYSLGDKNKNTSCFCFIFLSVEWNAGMVFDTITYINATPTSYLASHNGTYNTLALTSLLREASLLNVFLPLCLSNDSLASRTIKVLVFQRLPQSPQRYTHSRIYSGSTELAKRPHAARTLVALCVRASERSYVSLQRRRRRLIAPLPRRPKISTCVRNGAAVSDPRCCRRPRRDALLLHTAI